MHDILENVINISEMDLISFAFILSNSSSNFVGNTRIVGQEQLQKFQEGMKKIINDPFQVVMKQTKLPISLLSEKADVGYYC